MFFAVSDNVGGLWWHLLAPVYVRDHPYFGTCYWDKQEIFAIDRHHHHVVQHIDKWSGFLARMQHCDISTLYV